MIWRVSKKLVSENFVVRISFHFSYSKRVKFLVLVWYLCTSQYSDHVVSKDLGIDPSPEWIYRLLTHAMQGETSRGS